MLDYRVFTFIKVCETLNFTQAAKELHITQPAVTKHIKALETEYQTKLFTFSGKHCQLTQSGKELLDLLTTMDTDIKHFKTQLKQDLQPLNFGATLTIGEFYPFVNKQVFEGNNTISIQKATELVGEIAEKEGIEMKEGRVEEIWDKFDLKDFDMNRNILRSEMAILIDQILDPFNNKKVDIIGQYIQ